MDENMLRYDGSGLVGAFDPDSTTEQEFVLGRRHANMIRLCRRRHRHSQASVTDERLNSLKIEDRSWILGRES